MKIKKEKFEEMYYSMTNKAMANQLGISEVTLSRYVKKLGLRKRTEFFGNKKKVNII